MKVINERAFVIHQSAFDSCNAVLSAFSSPSTASPHVVLPTCCISATMAPRHMCSDLLSHALHLLGMHSWQHERPNTLAACRL
jgi:peptidoglycan/xylan/chitin deacetylase (PgdA/CDA1 family)